tara:strand:- start:593 stop:1663 length:1071 start_codon:yes stop_codon:yes gene_type:complete
MKTKKVLVFTRYDFIGPSSRLRFIQYFKFFEDSGLQMTHSPLFNDEYLKRGFKNKPIFFQVLQGYVKRFFKLLSLSKYDVVWIEKELFPYLPYFVENFFLNKSITYIVDYDDAIFNNYDSSKNIIFKTIFNKKIANIMRNASVVVVGNKHLKNYALREGKAKEVIELPTVVNLDSYPKTNHISNNKIIKVGWIGTPSTLVFLKPLFYLFQKLSKELDVEFIAIGVDKDHTGNSIIKTKEWSYENEFFLLQDIDIGIMPLPNNNWTKGKCGYKLIQYMACCKPVIASPIGINKALINQEENGYLAKDFKDWDKYLRLLIKSKKLRNSMGMNGRKLVEKKYSTEKVFPKLKEILLSIK